MNENLKNDLNIQVDNHSELKKSGVTETGLLKTSRGLVITGETRLSMPAVPASSGAAQPPASRARGRKRKKDPATVNVTVTLDSVGSFPAVYSHMYPGDGVLVLGLDAHSYVPAETSRGSDGELENTVSLDLFPGRSFAFAGNSFTDSDGIRNIILIEVKEKANG